MDDNDTFGVVTMDEEDIKTEYKIEANELISICDELNEGSQQSNSVLSFRSLLESQSTEAASQSPILDGTCRECGKVMRKKNLKAHIITKHSLSKPHMCKHCGRGFASASHLRQHMQIHGEKNYKCSECHFSSTKRLQLIRHMKLHAIS